MASIGGRLHERIESLIVSDEYKMFIVTGQAQELEGRRAFVAIRPFGEIDGETLAAMKRAAGPFEHSRVSVSRGQGVLLVHDDMTGTETVVAVTRLDADVQQKIALQEGALWARFGDAAKKLVSDTNGDAFATSAKAKPLAFVP